MIWFCVLIFSLTVLNGNVQTRPTFSQILQGLIPEILRGGDLSSNFPILDGETLIATPDETFSPVLVLFGEDDDNQTAVVVLGDENDGSSTKDDFDISAIIGQVVNNFNGTTEVVSSENLNQLFEVEVPTVLEQLPAVLMALL